MAIFCFVFPQRFEKLCLVCPGETVLLIQNSLQWWHVQGVPWNPASLEGIREELAFSLFSIPDTVLALRSQVQSFYNK